MSTSQPIALSQLLPGQRALIHSFSDDFLSGKLMEMGCLPGSEVRLEHIAPMGDPILISLDDSMLSLRKEEAATVVVTKIAGD